MPWPGFRLYQFTTQFKKGMCAFGFHRPYTTDRPFHQLVKRHIQHLVLLVLMIISPNEFNQRFGAAVIKLLQLFPFLYGSFFLLQSFFLLLSLSFDSALILQLFLGIECFLQPVDFIAVIYRKLKTDGSAPKPKRRIALTKTQQQNFLRFIAKSPTYSHWLPIMTVLLGTGMRVAECTGITKSDINLSENTISVNHNLIYRVIDGKAGFHITTPKTESGTRIIPILYPEVAEQLRLQIETIDALYPDDQLVLGGVHGFVFRNRTGSFMSAHNINRAIERISVTYNMEEMDQAELEDREPDLLPHFSVHNLRHTFCTRLCESTNDVKFIQQVMGHADFSTTMDIYTHITQENMQEKAKNISVNMKLM